MQYAIGRDRHCIIFVTYHYSRGDIHRGCRVFNYDKVVARDAAVVFKTQLDHIYGGGAVVPIVCGIETDFDVLILNGEDGSVLDLSEVKLSSQKKPKY